MKKMILLMTMVLLSGVTIPAMAQVTIEVAPPPPPRVRVAVPLPPPIVFPAPPEVVVLPETEVYVVPTVPEEIFFFNGYWWRPWNGRWYRSLRYDGGWGVYAGVPGWYRGIPHDWRDNYRHHLWGGHPWNYHHISHGDLHRNWRTWHNTGHWNKSEHREFTHHHDGRVYAGHHVEKSHLNRGATGPGKVHVDKKDLTHANINKSTTGVGQGHVNKGITQSNVNKTTTGVGQGNLNKGVTTQGNIHKSGATVGHGNVGTGGHGAAGNIQNSGQGQHN